MKIIVTGCAGLIGSWLCDALLELGHNVVGIDNLSSGYADNIPVHKNFQFVNRSLEDYTKLVDCFVGVDFVYHAAAAAYEGYSVFAPTAITQNIVGSSTAVITAAANARVKRVVNMSSMARYGHGVLPYRESSVPSPVDPYGQAKLFAEQQMNLVGKLHDVEVCHVVPHNVNGPRQRYDDPFRNVMSIMANMMLQGRQPIIYGDGQQARGFCDVRDNIQTLVMLLDASIEHGEVFNIGPDDPKEFVTVNRLAAMIADSVGFKSLDPLYIEPRPTEVKLSMCSSDKIKQRFNFKQTISLEENINSVVAYIRKRGTRNFVYHTPIEVYHTPLNIPRSWKERLF